ncbi:MAG: hypothetical protein AAB267_07255 [Candidatus Desantisbacteria bacterium]
MSVQQDIVFRLPSEIIMEILRRIPQRQLRRLQKELKEEVTSVSAEHLLGLTGIASVGGDALFDTERVWG